MSEKSFFSPKGRLNRLPYILRLLLFSFIIVFTELLLVEGSNEPGLLLFALLIWITCIVFMAIQAIKRLHDIDLSGWLYLIVLIPFANFIFGLFLIFKDGTKGPNDYGEDPKGRKISKSDIDNKTRSETDSNQQILANLEKAETSFNRGMSEFNKGSYKESIFNFNEALKYDSNNATTYNNRGGAKFELKDFKGAINDFNKSIEINPKWSKPYFNRGKIFLLFGDKQRATCDLNKSADLGNKEASIIIKEIEKNSELESNQRIEYDNFVVITQNIASYYMELNTPKYKKRFKEEIALLTTVGVLDAHIYVFQEKSITIFNIQDLAKESLKKDNSLLEFAIGVGVLISKAEEPDLLSEWIEDAWKSQKEKLDYIIDVVLREYPNIPTVKKIVKDGVEHFMSNQNFKKEWEVIGILEG